MTRPWIVANCDTVRKSSTKTQQNVPDPGVVSKVVLLCLGELQTDRLEPFMVTSSLTSHLIYLSVPAAPGRTAADLSDPGVAISTTNWIRQLEHRQKHSFTSLVITCIYFRGTNFAIHIFVITSTFQLS